MRNEYKEVRRLGAISLRQLCIDKNWYTLGDNEEYGHLLYDLAENKDNLNTDDIIEIAEDIAEHSDLGDEYLESVAFEVARRCNTFFERV